MNFRFSFHPYRRNFIHPLRTARGEWLERDGFILRAESDFGVGYGEIAPIPEFGSETVTQAEAFLWELMANPAAAQDAAMLADVPCCAFGLSAALVVTSAEASARRNYDVAALLPAGKLAVPVLQAKLARGYETFKWKIGVGHVDAEQAVFEQMIASLPTGAQLRLDANGGLPQEDLERWLWVLQRYTDQVDYLEQPLAVGQERVMAGYAESFAVPIALDESLNGAEGARWLSEWNGPLVVKPALMGDGPSLVERLRPVADRIVLSSVFETGIGLENALRVADQLPELKRAIGFDTTDAFSDRLCLWQSAAVITLGERAQLNPESIWKHLPYLS